MNLLDEILEEGELVPGELIIGANKPLERKRIIDGDADEESPKKQKRDKPPTKKQLRMQEVSSRCTEDVKVTWNWIVQRYNMYVGRIQKRKEGSNWEGFETRYYTVPKMLDFLGFMSEEFGRRFQPELEAIHEEGYIKNKPRTQEE